MKNQVTRCVANTGCMTTDIIYRLHKNFICDALGIEWVDKVANEAISK